MNNALTYAIGDIHGHLDKLRELHRLIEADQKPSDKSGVVVHVGDLVDRGPDSAGVVAYLMDGIARGKPWIVIKGNHDRMMSYYLETPSRIDLCLREDLTWLDPRLGGTATLLSYGVDVEAIEDPIELHEAAQKAVPLAHRQFLAGLNTMHQSGNTAFVHAGVRPGIRLSEQTEDDLVWIRNEFLIDPYDHGALIVHGHTPVDEVEHHGNRINIDTGVAYGGPLSAIAVAGDEVWNLGPDGRTTLKIQRSNSD